LQQGAGTGAVRNQLHSNKIAIMAAYHLGILQQVSGIQVIILYAGDILLKLYPFLEKIVPLFLQIVGLMASLQTVRLLPTRGRKELIQDGSLVMGITLLIVAFCFLVSDGGHLGGIIIVVGLVVARATFSMTLGPIVWLYIP
jgi:SP family arabinose:H+ symporter-like MFS transporter